MFDNCLELLVLAGRSLPHAMMMMIPEPWTKHESMSAEKKAFYEYHSCLMEPWDGPASIAFTDGRKIGAVLDRNGLRPSRYYVTKDDLVIMASEVGVLDVPADRVLQKGRLQPGRMFLVDTEEGRIVADEEIKHQIATAQPYREWLDQNLIRLADVPDPGILPEPDHETVLQRQLAFGYTFEDLRILMLPMARDGAEAVGSMGTDTPLAVLSNKPQPLFNYFKQLFAQVTNPPIDCIREEIITSTETAIGSERNLLKPAPEHARLIELKSPILTNEEFAKLKHIDLPGFKSITLPILFKVADGAPRPGEGDGRLVRQGQPGHQGRHQRGRPVGPRREQGMGADPVAAGGGRRASPPDPRRHAHPRRAGARIRRAARGAPLRAAHRLWLRRHQPVPGLRDARRHDPAGAADGHGPQDRLQELPQGRHEGRREGASRRWASPPSKAIGARRSSRPSA